VCLDPAGAGSAAEAETGAGPEVGAVGPVLSENWAES
jgi:hypothetical protein